MLHTPNSTTLNNGVVMPLLGLGVYDIHGRDAEQTVAWALEIGYRLFDTAAMYNNETAVGAALRQGGIGRQALFVTTKVHNNDHGYDATLRAFDQSLARLGCDYIDLYLVHWPLPQTRRQTWKALETLYAEGRVRAVGVANYLLPFLTELATYANVVPAVNQIEFSPYLYLTDELTYCRQHHIQLQAYSPLVRGQRFDDPRLLALARQYGKTPAQLLLRWALQHGVSVIPKSASRQRLAENFDVFDFTLSAESMARMDGLHENLRVVEDPMPLF
jgi:methylglyoxal/glyoxal reductase